jgi:hypothetical protein
MIVACENGDWYGQVESTRYNLVWNDLIDWYSTQPAYATKAEAVLDSLKSVNAQYSGQYYFHTGGSVPTLL